MPLVDCSPARENELRSRQYRPDPAHGARHPLSAQIPSLHGLIKALSAESGAQLAYHVGIAVRKGSRRVTQAQASDAAIAGAGISRDESRE